MAHLSQTKVKPKCIGENRSGRETALLILEGVSLLTGNNGGGDIPGMTKLAARLEVKVPYLRGLLKQ